MIERTVRLAGGIEAIDLAARSTSPLVAVGLVPAAYSDRMLRRLDRRIASSHVAARCATMHAAMLDVIGGIAETLTRHPDLGAALPEVLRELLAAGGQSAGALFMPDATGHRFEVATSLGLSPTASARLHHGCAHSPVLAAAASSLAPVGLAVAASDPAVRELLMELGGASALVVPFVADQACLGMLLMLSPSLELTEPDWLSFGHSMATQIGQAFARTQTTARLVASEARYRRLTTATSDGVAVVDQRGHITYVNPRLASMLGRAITDLVGRELVAFIAGPGADGEHEVRSVRADGTELWATVASSSIVDAAGHPDGSLHIVTDITERRRAEAAAVANAALQAELQRSQLAEAAACRLAGTVAHDLNNILLVILSYGDMLLEELPASGPVHSDISEIVRAGRRAAVLTEQLLQLSIDASTAPRVE